MGITVLLLAPLQKKIDTQITLIKKQSLASLEKKLGRKISYSSISPSFFMFLELRNVVIKNTDGISNLVSIGRVRIHYNLLKVLRGDITGAMEGVTLVTSAFYIDAEEDSDLVTLVKSLNSENGRQEGGLPQLTLSGKNISITLKSEAGTITLQHLFFTLKKSDTSLQYSIKGQFSAGAENIRNSTYAALKTLRTRFKLFGTSNTSLSHVNARLLLGNINSNLFSLRSLSLLIQREKNNLFVRKVEDSSPLDINVTYDSSRRILGLSILAEKFVPSEYIQTHPQTDMQHTLFSASYTTNIQLHYALNSEELTYTGFIKTSGKNFPFLGTYTAASKIKGNNRHIRFSYLSLVSTYGTVTYSGDFLFKELEPEGRLQIRKLKLKNYSISAALQFVRKDGSVTLESKKVQINTLRLLRVEGTVKRYENDISYSVSFSLQDPARQQNRISVEGSLQTKPSLELQMNVSTGNVPISPLLVLLKHVPVTLSKKVETVRLNSNSFINTDFTKTSFSVMKMEVYDSENRSNVIQCSASGNNDGLHVSNVSAMWGGEQLTGSIDLIKKEGTLTAQVLSVFNTYPFSFTVSYNQYGLFVSGDYGLSFAYLFSKNGANFMLHCDALPLPLKGKVTEVTLDTSGYYFNPSNWKLLLNSVYVKNAPFPMPENELTVSGELTQNNIELKTIQYTDSFSTVKGSASYTYSLPDKSITGRFKASNTEKTETYDTTASYTDNILNVTATVVNAPVKRFKNLGLSGLVSGKISVKGPLPSPDILLTLQVNKGLLQSSPFEMNATVQIKDKNILIKTFNGIYNNTVLKNGRGEFDVQKGNFSFSARYSGDVGGHKVASHLNFSGIFSLPDTPRDLSVSDLLHRPFTAIFTSQNGTVDLKKAANWKMTFQRDPDSTIAFNGGPRESISGRIQSTGFFSVHAGKGFPLRGTLTGKVQNGKIEALLKNSEIDLSVLNVIKISGFAFTTGTAYGDVTVRGPVDDPDFFGTLKVIGASGALSYLIDTITPFNTRIVFNGKDMHIEAADLKTGDAQVRTEADFTFTKWVPSVYTIQFTSLGQKSIHVTYKVSSIGLGVNGYARGTFRLKGDPLNLDLSGNLVVNNCVIALGEKKIKPSGPTGASTSVNIDFTTGRKVEFLWPSTTLPIVKAYADTNQYLHVRMDGTNDTYSIKGTIRVKYGEVYYFQRNFYLTNGSIIFNENETDFDPLLDFKAQIREVDSRGEVVNVYMILDKSPLSRFSPRFESDPPLSTVEIMSMLGSNVFAQLGGEKINISSALMLTGDLVSQFSIMRGFEQKVKDIFKLDLFSIRTQMIQNIIVDRFISESAAGNNSSDLFSKYLDNTTLYLGKYFGNTLFLQTMVQFGTDNPLAREQGSPSGPLRVQTKVSLEWKTPLFLLDFSVEPDFLDPVSSIKNTSLSLSWGYSY